MDKLIAMVREASEQAKRTVVYVPKGDLPDLALQGIWHFWTARQRLHDALAGFERSQALVQETARQMAEKEEAQNDSG